MQLLTRAVPCGPHGVDYTAFLDDALLHQVDSLTPYLLLPLGEAGAAEHVWLKKTGPRHGPWRYAALEVLARMVRLPALRAVPNPGGVTAIQTEARRLHELRACGLRVPEVLAVHDGGLLLRHLGRSGAPTASLADEMHHAAIDSPSQVLPLWQQGLEALGLVHDTGNCLSQGFARNLVRCPDGVMGYVDFEDDPASSLPLELCQVRDLLCYAHSTSLYLQSVDALEEAHLQWKAWQTRRPANLQRLLHTCTQRMHWMQHLPTTRRLGRDLQRARMAYALLR